MNIINVFHPNLSLLFLCVLLRFFLSSAESDTISANQSLSGDQTIVSKGGNFELGFFKPGNRSNYYVGIWYKKISLQFKTVVWVANRETPVSDKYSAHLTIQNGNLVLLNNSNKFPIWSTCVSSSNSSSSVNVIATLLNNGNLKLIDKGNGIWESFENPSHTWLPGGKLSYNKITKRNHVLISWKNYEDPAPGLYSLELIPGTKQYILMWNRTKQYWRSGEWNGHIFELVPEMLYNHRYNFTFIDNINESYFTYKDYDPSSISRLTIDVSGQVNQFTWLDNSQEWNMFWAVPRTRCDTYAYCGPFGIKICNEKSSLFCDCLKGYKPKFEDDWNIRKDFTGGCVRKTELKCDNSDKFWKLDLKELPEDSEFLRVRNVEECESACLKNCSCKAYAYYDNETDGSCSIWNWNNNREFLNLRKLSPGDESVGKAFYLRLAESEFSGEGKNRGKLMMGPVLAGSIVLALFLVGLVVWILIFRRRKQRRRRRRLNLGNQGSIVAFTYKELQIATKNFSEKLGGGGFGSVFRGTLPDSSVVAVKKLESVSQGEKQFRMEVSTIGTIQHVNLVRLRGFCSEGGDKKLLVYDYMENGSLDFHLFQGRQKAPLDWKTRYQIALGTARGLAYLHDKCRDCIIHCDIKPENILLDSEFCPKLADFGLAKLVGRDFSRVLTTIRGTRGYLAPEWISGVPVTAKTDVFSYGMMIFEFISGKRNFNSEQYSNSNSMHGLKTYFPALAGKVLADGGDILGLLDPRLNQEADEEEVSRLCRIACWCIQDEESERPSMGQVVQTLEGVLPVNLLPPPSLPRSLLLLGCGEIEEHEHEPVIFFTESSSSSDHTSSGGESSMTSSKV